MKTWVKGGLWGGTIALILGIITMPEYGLNINSAIITLPFILMLGISYLTILSIFGILKIPTCASFFDPTCNLVTNTTIQIVMIYALYFLLIFLSYFILGAIIGLIIQKIKSRNS
tara:strand:- start:148 stop:492 length:345 start_codon:yes stop_codon:yes gene_type:complete